MPIFEFCCPQCGKIIETVMGTTVYYPMCEECHVEMKKIMSVAFSRMYGGGVYKPNKREEPS